VREVLGRNALLTGYREALEELRDAIESQSDDDG